MKDFSSLKQALRLANMGIETSPLAPNTKVPLIPLSQGGHGYKDSTNDKAKLNKMFSNAPKANLCLRLDTSHLIMVDVDLHTEQANGKETLVKLAKRGMKLPNDTYIESTPHNGIHYYFKADVPIKDINEAFGKSSGVEIHTHSSSIYPSEIDGKQYKPLDGHELNDVKPAPQWLLDYITKKSTNKRPSITARCRNKLYTGQLLDEFVNGASSGSRNAFITRIAGRMFAVGAEADTVYNMLLVINDNFLTPPLKEREINIIFESILRRDSQPQFNF
ncbi:bifunctional DNA primase/polymerase [Pediococcus inopinatus]|uniref:bifunctional DNA primase/polymerase n=1 Tax=Pediococcus inopinatus TaxID=114090 RepID=UPI002B25740B|nr:bifunctional DNA primase/polymerase [Pediococcus inopinatus]WPC18144.1 bifunctional DNA primase/polymerase [Pediococcus inopinatus]